MYKEYSGNVSNIVNQQDIESYYQEFVLPEFGIDQPVTWVRHLKTDPDSFVYVFTADDTRYALAFDDYPGDFSIGSDKAATPVKLLDGEEILHVSSAKGEYREGVIGSFMLFRVVNDDDFNELVDYLIAAYSELQKKWRRESNELVVVARDILQIAETASQNHDTSMLYSLQNIVETFTGMAIEDNSVDIALLEEYVKILSDEANDYELYTPSDKERVAGEIYKALSQEAQNTITVQKYGAKHIGQTVTLVSAMYGKTNHGMTEGISVAIIFEDEQTRYPTDHFINDDLRRYFADNVHVSIRNIEHHMPEVLRDYRLIQGSVHVREVFTRELAYISY